MKLSFYKTKFDGTYTTEIKYYSYENNILIIDDEIIEINPELNYLITTNSDITLFFIKSSSN